MVANVVIVDLDGTLANSEHRAHHLRKEKKDWEAYYQGVSLDEPHEDIIELVNCLKESGYTIVILTGRRESTRAETENWLRHHNAAYDILLMRADDNRRDDHLWKPEMVEGLGKSNIFMIIEDRNRIVKALRDEGFRVIQVQDGDF